MYKIGVGGPLLANNLNNLDTSSFSASDLQNYPTLQKNNFCAGDHFNNNNYNNQDLSLGTSVFTSSDHTTYDPRFSQYPNFSTNKQFDF